MSTKHWCNVWGNAMSITDHKVETYSKNITLRYPIKMPFSGEQIKLTFDNFCGTEAIEITEAYIAKQANVGDFTDRSIIKDSSIQIHFSGEASCTIEAGARLVCDPIAMEVAQNEVLVVSFYLGNFTQMRSSVIATGPLSKGFYSVGNQCLAEVLPMDYTRNTSCFYFLSDVSLYTDSENHALICYGDSITAQDWPDELALMYMENPNNHTAVVRKAASGTRILRQYSNITYESYGLKADVRFPHEMPVEGASAIIIQQGINDIIHPVGEKVNPFRPMSDLPTVEELEKGLQYYIDFCSQYSYDVYLGTLLPIKGWRTYELFREEMKNEFNEWIRNCNCIKGCIDFDLAVRDPAHPACFAEGFDSGDHLHPSNAAYKAMALAAYKAIKNSSHDLP